MDSYTLGIPNTEVRRGLYNLLLPAFSGASEMRSRGLVRDMTRALRASDMDRALRLLRSYLAGLPYDLAARDEKGFQTILFLIFELVGIHVATEVRVATGHIDVLVDTDGELFVMELKYRREGKDHPNASDALRQIDVKGYLIPFEAGPKPVTKVGVAFSEELRTLDEGWLIERA